MIANLLVLRFNSVCYKSILKDLIHFIPCFTFSSESVISLLVGSTVNHIFPTLHSIQSSQPYVRFPQCLISFQIYRYSYVTLSSSFGSMYMERDLRILYCNNNDGVSYNADSLELKPSHLNGRNLELF